MLEKIFKLKENKTNVYTEFIAGLTTFMAMSYIIFVNPTVLSQTGMDYNAVYGATILASIIGTLVLSLYANVPYAQSAGIGLGSLFTYTLCGSMGYSWQQSLAMVFICAVINLIVTLTSFRKKIITAIPNVLQEAITIGIGLFITYIGLMNAGFIVFKADNVTNGFASNVIPTIATFNTPTVLLSILGILLLIILVVLKVKGAYLISIILTTIMGIPLGVTQLPDFSNYTIFPSLAPTFMQLDFAGLLTAKASLTVVFMTIFTLCISDLFDTIGIFIGTGKKSGIFKISNNNKLPKKLERALVADSTGSLFGSMLGTSNVTTYLESTAGIEAGGRTGLTSLFVSLFFFLALFISPLIKMVPTAAVAPVLIMIGLTMIEGIGNINWKDMVIAIPAFFTIVLMPLAYSITTGIEIGFILYTLINYIAGNKKEVSPIMVILSILFIINFVFTAL
ncbi:MAG: NCS2 family permease [Bacilli bacterium]|nr:NCS2 family permease [Bacilli bacterium]